MHKIIQIITIICLSQFSNAQVKFSHFFKNKTLRIDFTIGGNDSNEMVFWKQIKKENFWGGSKNKTIDVYQSGDYRYNIYDINSKQLIYSKGFNSLFREWQTTGEAQSMNRSFYHVITCPFPKNDVICEIQSRGKNGIFKTISKINIDRKTINSEKIIYESEKISKHIKPNRAIDIVFLSEGYTQKQMGKFIEDVKKFTKYIFDIEPFKSHKKIFNIHAVKVPSKENGTDNPGKNIYRNTAFNSTFYTFGSPRYLTSQNIKAMYDAAANVPYDHIFVLVNTTVYGGGAIYNHYSCCSADCEFVYEISSHELAHGLFGLADEYYSNDDEINFYYNLSVEPWNANITTLVDFKKKWKHLVDENTPIPTSRTLKYKKKIGAFEGGSYVKKGVYSPMQDCKMKSNEMKTFCPVCRNEAEKIINFLID